MGICCQKVYTHLSYPLDDKNKVFAIWRSQFYNYFQESLLFPHRYILYDVRQRSHYMKKSVRTAIWAWERTNRYQRQNVIKCSEISYLEDPEAQSFINALKVECTSKYVRLLLKRSLLKVIIFGNRKSRQCIQKLLDIIKNYKIQVYFCCVLQEGFKSLLLSYYKPLISLSLEPAGPIEVIVPKRPKLGKGLGLYISGTDILKSQLSNIKRLKIKKAINLSEEHLSLSNSTIDIINLNTSSIICIQAAEVIYESLTNRKSVIVLDDFEGRELASASCVAFLVMIKANPDMAVQYIKELKPSADMNFLSSILGLEISDSITSKSSRGGFVNLINQLNMGTRIPLNCFDVKFEKIKSRRNFSVADSRRYKISKSFSRIHHKETVDSASNATVSDVDTLFADYESNISDLYGENEAKLNNKLTFKDNENLIKLLVEVLKDFRELVILGYNEVSSSLSQDVLQSVIILQIKNEQHIFLNHKMPVACSMHDIPYVLGFWSNCLGELIEPEITNTVLGITKMAACSFEHPVYKLCQFVRIHTTKFDFEFLTRYKPPVIKNQETTPKVQISEKRKVRRDMRRQLRINRQINKSDKEI